MKYHERYEISCSDVDENNHIRPTSLMRYFQDMADHQLRDRKPSYYDLFFDEKAFIITKISVEIYGQLQQYDVIDTYTWTWDGKSATYPRCYEIYKDGECMVRASSEWVLVNHRTGHLYRTSEIDTSNYDKDEPLELTLPKRFRYPKDLEFQEIGTKHVFYSDCDMNRHMNNANYLNILWEQIPDVMDKEITSMNMRFQREAPLGADIQMQMAQPDLDFGKDANAEELYAFRTTVDGATNFECMFGMRPTEKPDYSFDFRDETNA